MFRAGDGIRDAQESRGLGGVDKGRAEVAGGMEVNAAAAACSGGGQVAALGIGDAVEVHSLLGARALNGWRGCIVSFVEVTLSLIHI